MPTLEEAWSSSGLRRAGGGKSGGFRTIILFRAATRACFVHGFAKSERENIDAADLEDLRLIASDFLAADDKGFERITAQQDLQEIKP